MKSAALATILIFIFPVFAHGACRDLKARLAAFISDAAQRADALELLRQETPSTTHKIRVRNFRAEVTIGDLGRDDISYARALAGAVRAGAVSKLDAEYITGGKVLPLLVRLSETAAKHQSLEVRGTLSPSALLKSMHAFSTDATSGIPYLYSATEEQLILRAFDKLRARAACRKFYGTDDLALCGRLSFVFDASKIDKIRWSVPKT